MYIRQITTEQITIQLNNSNSTIESISNNFFNNNNNLNYQKDAF